MNRPRPHRIAPFVAGLSLLATAAGCGRVDRSDQVVIWEQMDPRERTLLERHIAEFQATHPEYAAIRISRANYNTEDLRTQFQTCLLYTSPSPRD